MLSDDISENSDKIHVVADNITSNSQKIHRVAGHVANISDHVANISDHVANNSDHINHNYVKIHFIDDYVDNVKVSSVLYSKFFTFLNLGNQNIYHISSN